MSTRSVAPARPFALLAALLLFPACQPTLKMPANAAERDRQLSNGYSLLHDLLTKQSDVNKVTYLRTVSEPSQTLLADVSRTSDDAVEKIEAFVKADRSLGLDQLNLPTLEKAARDKIESAATKRILLTSDHVELELLLDQAQATRYGAYLAQALSEIEKTSERKKWLEGFSSSYLRLNQRTLRRLIDLTSKP